VYFIESIVIIIGAVIIIIYVIITQLSDGTFYDEKRHIYFSYI